MLPDGSHFFRKLRSSSHVLLHSTPARPTHDTNKMDPMNRIPEEPHIYIGSLEALDDPEALDAAAITHILTVLDYDHCDWDEFNKFERLYIETGDIENVDIIQHFDATNNFLDTAVSKGGTVLVHCAFGISRSCTLVMAFLMSRRGKSFDEALETIRKGRPFAMPNMGFEGQLKTYEKMLLGKSREGGDAKHKKSVASSDRFESSETNSSSSSSASSA